MSTERKSYADSKMAAVKGSALMSTDGIEIHKFVVHILSRLFDPA
jgi:prolyl oligopeptidase PreP (S9A serine peptidase family)